MAVCKQEMKSDLSIDGMEELLQQMNRCISCEENTCDVFRFLLATMDEVIRMKMSQS